MKRKMKMLLTLAICLIMLNITTVVFASDTTNTDISGKGANDIIQAGSSWLSLGQDDENTTVMAFANQLIGIGQVLVAIAIATILIVTAIMAIKWITATPDKQAKLKQQLIGLVVSIIVIFGAVGIWNLVRSIMQNIENSLA